MTRLNVLDTLVFTSAVEVPPALAQSGAPALAPFSAAMVTTLGDHLKAIRIHIDHE